MSAKFESFVSRPTLAFAAAALSCLAFADRSNATTATSTFTTQVTVNSTCIVSSGNIDFGPVGVLTANVDASSTLTVQCTNTTVYDIGLNAGTGSGASVATRKMTNGSATVNYSLYTDSAHTTVWGNTIGSDVVHATGNGAAQSYPVYGRVPPQTTPAAGVYTDTITVTVTY
jgi:spore coat protein U-like protein